MPRYLVTVEVEVEAREPAALEAVTAKVIAEGLPFYACDDTDQPFERLRILQHPAIELSDDAIRRRRMAEGRLHARQQLRMATFLLPEPSEPATQLAMPGL